MCRAKNLSVTREAVSLRRADVSGQTWRNHRDRLTALGTVRETDGGWRLALPFRASDEYDVRPWFVKTNDESELPFVVALRSPGTRLATQLLPEDDVGPVLGELRAGWTTDPDDLVERWPWLEGWLSALRVVTAEPTSEDSGPDVEPVVFGKEPVRLAFRRQQQYEYGTTVRP